MITITMARWHDGTMARWHDEKTGSVSSSCRRAFVAACLHRTVAHIIHDHVTGGRCRAAGGLCVAACHRDAAGPDHFFHAVRPEDFEQAVDLVLGAGRLDHQRFRADVDDPRSLRGELLLVEDELVEGEWLAADLVGCSVPGLGAVAQVIDAPSCSVLELDDGTLIPFVSAAIERVDTDGREIHVREGFLA